MKNIYYTLILVIFILPIKAQDCNTLNDFNSIHGIKFGQQFNNDIKKHFESNTRNSKSDTSYITYSLVKKSIEKNSSLHDRFYKLFLFGSASFSHLTIACLTDGRVYEFNLSKYYRLNDIISFEDSIEIAKNQFPKTFNQATEELNSLFGNFTKTNTSNDFIGYHYYQYWECEKVKIELSFEIDDLRRFPFSYMVDLRIIDVELEKKQKLNYYKN